MATQNIVQSKNLGPQDIALQLVQALPAAGANVTTGYIDMQFVGPNSDSWSDGLFVVNFPALPENQGTGITVALQGAYASLTAGNPAGVAPNTPPPGAFVTPADAQTATLVGVAGTGSIAQKLYLNVPVDAATGSPYQFYQFVITTPAGTATTGELVTIGWEDRH